MPKAYSEDLRKRVVAARRSGQSAEDVAAMFGVHRNCVYRWDQQERTTGSLAAGYVRVTGRKPKIKVDEKFEAFARFHMHSTLEKMAQYWEGEVSRMSMSRSLAKLGWSRKKKACEYQEACPKERVRFVKKLDRIPEDWRVWVDETGMNGNETYEYGWSPKGDRCPGVRPGNREGRVSIIAGLRAQKLVAPCWFTGSCNTRVFNAWLAEMLLPEIPIGSTIILDNARFHQSNATKRIVRKAGCKLLFLPKYSPKDNLIEHQWFPVKNDARKIMQTFQDPPSAIEVALLKRT